MSTLLIAIIGLLVLLIVAFTKVWIFDAPKGRRGPGGAGYAGPDSEAMRREVSSRRSRAWDAAVARARNRFH